MLWIAVALGAAIGAPTRFAIERWFVRRKIEGWPYGTFVANQSGALVLGVLTGFTLTLANGDSEGWMLVSALVGTGFCGALTTFSGWASQMLELTRGLPHWRGAAYGLASVGVGFALATAGFVLGVALA
ncbi:MAG: CrcB family protein [Actinobacteria bacterium]|nr:CrcB family protein [Actinomycetota bacterium]